MSSITIGDLKEIISNYPDNYEVIMKIKTMYDCPAGTSIAYINAVEPNHDYHEIYLKN